MLGHVASVAVDSALAPYPHAWRPVASKARSAFTTNTAWSYAVEMARGSEALGMSLHIYIAHTGERFDVDPISFTSLDELYSWAAEATQIPAHDQILLTLKGHKVKDQKALFKERELYLYDRELFKVNPNSSPLVPPTPLPEPFTPEDPPDGLSNKNNLKAWQELFKSRQDWAFGVVDRCRAMCSVAQQHTIDQSVVERGLRVAVGNHESYLRSLEQKEVEARSWLEEVTKEQQSTSGSWEEDIARLKSVQAKEGFRTYIAGQDGTPRKETRKNTTTTLDTFIDPEAVLQAASVSKSVIQRFGDRIAEIGPRLEKVAADYGELVGAIGQSQSLSAHDESARLLQEIEVVANKVATDYEQILSLPSNPKSLAQVSKSALLHTRSYLPHIRDVSLEISDLVHRSIEQKNATISITLEHMQTVAAIESALAGVSNDINSLEIPPEGLEALDSLALVVKLPFVYGSLLVEAVRREEWVEKMKHDSSTLQEELAGYQDEEQRRRKRWLKGMADVLRVESLEGKALGVEINLQGDSNGLPHATREDLDTFLNTLNGLEGMEPIVNELGQLIKELDKPTRQQVKRAKVFKNGSLHDQGFGKGSLLLRGADEMRVMREANAKLEEELKGQKSRVRKLEDLLHRQSHSGRLSSIGGFEPQVLQTQPPATPPPMSLPSPRPQDELSRRSSISSRRFSSNQGGEEKVLTRRLLKLEAELSAEREARITLEKEFKAKEAELTAERETHATLEKDVRAKDTELKEANFTKNDLMENMEAQQKEFAQERTFLQEELEKFKIRNEEVEDELDRILGSRDNERNGTEDRMRSLVNELDQIRREAADDVQKAEEQTKTLEEQIKTERDDHTAQLLALHAVLGPVESVTAKHGVASLIASVEQLVIRSQDHITALESAIAIAKSDNERLQAAKDTQAQEIHSLTNQLTEQESNGSRLREGMAMVQAEITSLQTELGDEQKHLADLRSKFAEGETGSEVLRQRLVEEEAKVTQLMTELAQTTSHNTSLDAELSKMQSKYQGLEGSVGESKRLLEERSAKAKELTNRLYAQYERLSRLLETLGFAITHQDDMMIVQRASKTSASVLGESGNLLQRSSSAPPVPLKKALTDLSDIALLKWMDAPDAATESEQFEEFLTVLDRFNLDTFSDAISKRMRDIEYTALKWKKEVKNYREKAHRAQGDAHDKLAIRGFKEGDLALFLPTRNQATRPWAAFNVGAPHYFLREQDSHRLQTKEWLVARITKVEERVVNLSQAGEGAAAAQAASDRASVGGTSDGGMSYDDDNPFQLSDGLRWYLLDAAEEKAGAPTTPILGKATVGGVSKIAAKGIRHKTAEGDATKTLHKSLESRRSSSNSKKSLPKANSNEALVGSGSGDAAASNNDGGRSSHNHHNNNNNNNNINNNNHININTALWAGGVDRRRATSQASSLRPTSLLAEGDAAAEDTIITTSSTTTTASPGRSAASSPSRPSVPGARGASSSSASPSRSQAKGLWQSLWQLDVNY